MLPNRNYSAHDVGSTVRPTSTSLFTIDSEDRYDDYTQARTGQISPYDFSINLPASLMNGFFTRLALTEIVFPWVIPNITQKTNKIKCIAYYDDGVSPPSQQTVTITLPVGFYTPAELATAVALEINGTFAALFPTAPNFQMGYGGGVGLIGFLSPIFNWTDGTGNYSFAFEPMTPLSAAWPYNNQTRQLFDLLGFNLAPYANWDVARVYAKDQRVVYANQLFQSSVDGNVGNVPAVPSAFWTKINNTYSSNLLESQGFGGQTFAQGTRYVDIVSPQLAYNQALKDSSSQKTVRDSLCRLYIIDPANVQSTTPVDDPAFCPPGCQPTTIYRNFTQPKQIQWLPNQPITGSLRFLVYDDEGDILTGQDFVIGQTVNRTNWSMTILVSEN